MMSTQPCPDKSAEAERAPRSYLDWWTSIETDVRKSMLVWAHRDTDRLHALVKMAYEEGVGAARRTQSAAEGAEGLPPLPVPRTVMQLADEFGSGCDAYTIAQVEQIRRDAIAADRKAQAGAVQQPAEKGES